MLVSVDVGVHQLSVPSNPKRHNRDGISSLYYGTPVMYAFGRGFYFPAALFTAAAPLLIFAPLYTARACQSYTVGRIPERCQTDDLEPIQTTIEPLDDARTMIRLKNPLPNPKSTIDLHTEYIVAECLTADKHLLFEPRYDAANSGNNFSRLLAMNTTPPPNGRPQTIRCFFPV